MIFSVDKVMQDIKKTIDADANGVDRGILKKAVALEYKPNTSYDAPIVKAKGQGYVAQRIIALALEKDIPVIKNADMAEMLSALDVGEEIPPEAFVAVAQIIRYIYDSNGQELPFFES